MGAWSAVTVMQRSRSGGDNNPNDKINYKIIIAAIIIIVAILVINHMI